MASNNIARLGVVLGLDMAEFSANIDKAISENRKLKNEIQRHTNAAVRELNALTEATADYGREVTKVEQIQRQIASGKFASATDDMKQKLLAQAAAYDAKVIAEKKSFDGTKLTMQQQQQLAFQTTDLVTQIASGQNALVALLQQGGQLKDSMGGFSNMFKVLAAQITPFRLAIGGTVAALGTLGLAFYQGYQESARLRDDLILTGRYAGITQEQFLRLASTVSDKLGTSVGNAKDVFGQLVASGKFTQTSLDSVGEAILRVAQLSGKTAEQVAQDLIPSFNGSASAAKSLNDKMHFLTLEQYKQIAALEKLGKTQEAAKLTADALNQKLSEQERPLGILEKAWNALKSAASGAWDAMLGIGRQMDLEARLQKQIDDATAMLNAEEDPTSKANLKMARDRDALQAQLDALRKKREEETKRAQEESKNISMYEGAGGLAKETALRDELARKSIENRFALERNAATEIGKIELEASEKIALARLQMEQKNRNENNVFAKLNEENLAKDIVAINLDKEQKIRAAQTARIGAMMAAEQEFKESLREDMAIYEVHFAIQQSSLNLENKALELKKQELELNGQNLYMSDLDLQKLRLRMEYEQRREAIRRDPKLSSEATKSMIDQLNAQEQMKIGLLEMEERLSTLRNMSNSVFENMMRGIETFVRTGKMSFKDLARSIIQDLIMIQMRMQVIAIFRMISGSIGTAMAYGTNIGSQQTNMLAAQDAFFKADGGPVAGNQPYVVGERGPELFVPRGAGTIIPNNQMGGMGTTNVTNNYISAIDVKSFEERIFGSANAVWAASTYAQKRLPIGAGRM
jgi:lambda family phage tail tape measure protein